MNEAMLTEISRLADEGPAQAELDRVVAQYEREFLGVLSTTSDRADAINEAWLDHGDPAWLNTFLSKLVAVSADDVVAATRNWLRPDDVHTLNYLAEDPA